MRRAFGSGHMTSSRIRLPDSICGDAAAALGQLLARTRSHPTVRRAVLRRRLAALAPSHTWLIPLSVDVVPASGDVGWTLVLEAHPHPGRAVYTDLAADEFSALINADHTVVDLPTYLRGGSRCFAAIVEPSEGDGSVFFPSLSPEQIRPTLGHAASYPPERAPIDTTERDRYSSISTPTMYRSD